MGRLERLPDPETQARLWAAFVAAYSATKTRGGVDGFLAVVGLWCGLCYHLTTELRRR